MKIIDRQHSFYKPLWRRVAIVAFVAGWLVFEVTVSREPLWIAGAGALLAYAVWVFLINWPKETGGQS